MVKKVAISQEKHLTPTIRKGKQPKHFLNNHAALDLATVIAEAQEEKTLSRAAKNHHIQAGHPRGADQKPKLSASKMKLKETKALLAAQRAHRKREKAKGKRQRCQTSNEAGDESRPTIAPEGSQTRKRVSFAQD